MSDDRVTERRRTAYHEAGHAVVARFLGVPVDGVSIVADDEANGRTTLGMSEGLKFNLSVGLGWPEAEARQHIAVSYAGQIAEDLVFGDHDEDRAEKDVADITAIVLDWPRLSGYGTESMRKQAHELLASPAGRTALELVATALLERQTLSGNELAHIPTLRPLSHRPA